MIKEYEMTEEQFERLLKASQPVSYLVVGNAEPTSPQERANAAWRALGAELGFDPMTVKPTNKGDRFFTAESNRHDA